MKKSAILLYVSWSVLLFSGCSKSDEPSKKEQNQNNKEIPTPDTPERPDGPVGFDEGDEIDINQYLMGFNRATEFKATVYPDYTIVVSHERGYYCSYINEKNPDIDPEKTETYIALCQRYGDTGYKNVRKYYPFYLGGYDYLMDNIVSIDIAGVTDYDADHPAGSSLKDICELAACSPKEYIASGYADSFDWTIIPNYISNNYLESEIDNWSGRLGSYEKYEGLMPFCKPLAECSPEDMVLMGNGCENVFMLRFTKKPDAGNKLQRFIITMIDERGKTYTVETGVCEWE